MDCCRNPDKPIFRTEHAGSSNRFRSMDTPVCFFNDVNNTYGTGTQIELAFPMIAGVVPEDKLQAVEQLFMMKRR